MQRKLTIEDIPLEDKRVLMRVDFNVPQNEDGTVRDDTRIREALKSIEYARDRNARIVLMSHLGRPEKITDDMSDEDRSTAQRKNDSLKMNPIAEHLATLTKGDVSKVDDVVGADASAAVENMKPGAIVVLENTRFHPGETKNDRELSRALAAFGDVYVSDAFGSVHRAHASTVGVTEFLQPAAAGFLVAKELEYFGHVLEDPERPLTAILGGAKVADKILVIENLLKLVDTLIVGGGMAYTFMRAQGNAIGDSLLDEPGLDTAKTVIEKAKAQNVELLLPKDSVVADAFDESANTKIAGQDIEPGWRGLDIGPASIERFKKAISASKTVIWNGPMGVFEWPAFEAGTKALMEHLAQWNGTSIIGGGDTAAAVRHFGLSDRMSHVSTGGGASLEMLEGKTLPGIAALTDA